jgi:hypothetical protein
MSLDPEEPAIRIAFERRRPVAVPAELLARVSAVPREVRPWRPMPVRLALGVAPWVAVVAAGIVLAFGPRLVALVPSPGTNPGEPAAGWTPETTGGIAEIGIFGLPWVPLLLALALWGAWLAVHRARAGKAPIPNRHEIRAAATRRPKSIRQYLAYTIPILGIWALVAVTGDWSRLGLGSQAAPGPGVSEVTTGYWFSETIFHAGNPTAGPCTEDGLCPGPRWVYRVAPGEAYSYIASLRNDSMLPITVLGRSRVDGRAEPYGLGLLKDSANLSADPSNVVAFAATTLWPGQEVVMVFVDSRGSCADPAATLGPPEASVRSLPGIVYEVLGRRQEAWLFPRFEITVAGCDKPS